MLAAMPVADLLGTPPVALLGGLGATIACGEGWCSSDCQCARDENGRPYCACGNGVYAPTSMAQRSPGGARTMLPWRPPTGATARILHGLSGTDIGMLAAGVLPDTPIPGLPPIAPAPDHPPMTTGETVLAVGLVVGGLAALGVLAGFYNRWAYGDWTCMFKACVQSSQKRG